MYQTESLILYVVNHNETDIEQTLINELNKIKGSRTWAVAEPNVVVTDDEIFGINVTLYSALKEKLPRDIDRLCFQDAEAIIDFGKKLSASLKIEIEVDYHDECIGGINNGKVDKTLQVGLLDEWKKVL